MRTSSSSEGTQSPNLLATPTTTYDSAISEMGDRVLTPPSVHRGHVSRSTKDGRGSDKKARHAKGEERGKVSTSIGSEDKHVRSNKPGRERVDVKKSSKELVEQHATSTRTRSRREGLEGSSDEKKDKKDPVKRMETQTLVRIALLCKLLEPHG